MDVRLKHFMGGISLSLGIFWAFLGGGGDGGVEGTFSVFLCISWERFGMFSMFS